MIAIIFQLELRRKWAAVDTIMKKLTPGPTFMVRLAVAPVRRSPYTQKLGNSNTAAEHSAKLEQFIRLPSGTGGQNVD
jgi:hypothetical protein